MPSDAIGVDDELRLARIILIRCLEAHKSCAHDEVEFAVEERLLGRIGSLELTRKLLEDAPGAASAGAIEALIRQAWP